MSLKFLCLTSKFYSFLVKVYILEYVKSENKAEKVQNFDNHVDSSSKSIGKFL